MNSPMSLRIKRLVDELFNGNNSEFARSIGVSEGAVRSYFANTLPSADVLEKIALSSKISCEWLLIGEGEMLKSENNVEVDDETAETLKKLAAQIASKDKQIKELKAQVKKK